MNLKVYPLAVAREELGARAEQFRQMLAGRDPGFAKPARELYDLLVAPAREQLRGKTSLVVVPDGSLWDLPFQALQSSPGHYLLEDSAISYAPSLSVLLEMERARQKGAARRDSTETLLAVGNPAISKETETRAASVLMGGDLGPLPEAERQVKELALMYGPARSKVFTGEAAREEAVKTDAPNYRVLQLATHGVLNDASPMYSYVALARAERGEEDGLLEAWEMMRLDLHADLVVLSACETARGRATAGEGVIGMSWALFVAGTPTIVASQWKVESSSTTDLMIEFHRNLITLRRDANERGAVAEALRRASLKLMRGDDYRHPFYWAGFVVVGSAR